MRFSGALQPRVVDAFNLMHAIVGAAVVLVHATINCQKLELMHAEPVLTGALIKSCFDDVSLLPVLR